AAPASVRAGGECAGESCCQPEAEYDHVSCERSVALGPVLPPKRIRQLPSQARTWPLRALGGAPAPAVHWAPSNSQVSPRTPPAEPPKSSARARPGSQAMAEKTRPLGKGSCVQDSGALAVCAAAVV